MDLTYALTGILPATIIVAVVLTAAASAFLLWLFRRATLRGMKQETGAAPLASKQSERGKAATASYSPLTIQGLQGGMLSSAPAEAKDAYGGTAHSQWVTVAVYAAGGLVYALILTIPWMITAGGGFILSRFLWLFVCYAWPTLLAVGLIAAMDRWESLGVAGGYFATVIMIALYGLIRNPALSIGELVYFWLFANAPGTITARFPPPSCSCSRSAGAGVHGSWSNWSLRRHRDRAEQRGVAARHRYDRCFLWAWGDNGFCADACRRIRSLGHSRVVVSWPSWPPIPGEAFERSIAHIRRAVAAVWGSTDVYPCF